MKGVQTNTQMGTGQFLNHRHAGLQIVDKGGSSLEFQGHTQLSTACFDGQFMSGVANSFDRLLVQGGHSIRRNDDRRDVKPLAQVQPLAKLVPSHLTCLPLR